MRPHLQGRGVRRAGRRPRVDVRHERHRLCLRREQAGSEPKQVTWYDADHFLNAVAIRDEVAWLHAQIGIDSGKFVAKVTNLQPDAGP